MRERINKYCVDCLMKKYAGEEQCKCWRTALTNISKSVYLRHTKKDMCATLLAYYKHIQETCLLDTLTKVYTYNPIWTNRSWMKRRRIERESERQAAHRHAFNQIDTGVSFLL